MVSEFRNLAQQPHLTEKVPRYSTVLRRIAHWQFDHATDSIYASAFKNDNGLDGSPTKQHSVNWDERTSIAETMAGHWGRYGLVAITVLEYEAKEQQIEYSPKADNRAHCDAVGDKTNSVKNYLRKQARILIRPSR